MIGCIGSQECRNTEAPALRQSTRWKTKANPPTFLLVLPRLRKETSIEIITPLCFPLLALLQSLCFFVFFFNVTILRQSPPLSITIMAEFDTQPDHLGHDSEVSGEDLEKRADQQLNGGSDSGLEDAEKGGKPPPNPMMDPKSFPDGGKKAWLTVLGSSACMFVSFGWVNCVGVFQEYYQANQLKAYTASDISWIPALQSRSSASYPQVLF